MILHIQNIPPQYKLILKYHRRKQQVKKMTTTKNEKPCAGRFMLLLIFLFSLHLERSFAQQKNYFQQIVDYKIEVTLDDENHLLQTQNLGNKSSFIEKLNSTMQNRMN